MADTEWMCGALRIEKPRSAEKVAQHNSPRHKMTRRAATKRRPHAPRQPRPHTPRRRRPPRHEMKVTSSTRPYAGRKASRYAACKAGAETAHAAGLSGRMRGCKRSGGAQQSDRAGLGLVSRVCHWMPPLRSANAAWSRVALHECGVELGSSRGVELGGRVALGSVTTGITSTWKVRMRARSLGRRSRRGCFRPSPRVRPHGARRELALRRK